MSMSLQEQLLKAGLSNEKKAKKAKKSNKKSRELKREVKAAAEQKKQAELEKSNQLNQQLKEVAQQKEIQAQIKQLISMNQQTYNGGIKYNFTDGAKVEFLMVSELIQSQLAKGILAIVRFENDYTVVPSVVVEKISQKDGSCIVSKLDKSESTVTVEEEDPYADYVIPDDLMW